MAISEEDAYENAEMDIGDAMEDAVARAIPGLRASGVERSEALKFLRETIGQSGQDAAVTFNRLWKE